MNGLMEGNTKVIGKMERCMERANSHGAMEKATKVTMKMT